MEERFLLWIHEHGHPALDVVFLVSHYLGTELFCVVLVLLAALFWRLKGEGREALLWLLLGTSTWILQAGLKVAVERPRPELWVGSVALASFAFPSGHALASATFYPLLARGVAKLRSHWAAWAYAAAGLMALYIGLGRLYLGVHWPTDVLAGWTLGGIQTAFALFLLDRRTVVERAPLEARSSDG
jgi:membrane-associated phospholipid phosphatase